MTEYFAPLAYMLLGLVVLFVVGALVIVELARRPRKARGFYMVEHDPMENFSDGWPR